jgi:hypothetical protein
MKRSRLLNSIVLKSIVIYFDLISFQGVGVAYYIIVLYIYLEIY